MYTRTRPVEEAGPAPSEQTQYRRINSAAVSRVMFCDDTQKWILNDVSNPSPLHPLLPLFYVTTLLNAYAENGDDEDKLFISRMTLSPSVGGLELRLIGGMGILPGAESGINEFLLYATNSYGNKNTHASNQKRYDCIQTLCNENDEPDSQNDESDSNGLYENDSTQPFSQVSIVQGLTLPYVCLMSVIYIPYVYTYIPYVSRILYLCIYIYYYV